MENEKQPREFLGVWIPREIYLAEDLSWTEKILLVEITSLDTDERGCFASNEYFTNFLGIKKKTSISRMIKKLKEKDLIWEEKFDGRHRILHSNAKAELAKKLRQSSPKREDRVSQKANHINIDNNIDNNINNITCEDKPRNDVQELLRLFYENLNPNIKFQNKTLRADAEFLVNHYPLDKLEAMILYIKEHQGEQYFPTITTPTQLRDKMASIINHKNREKKESKIIKI